MISTECAIWLPKNPESFKAFHDLAQFSIQPHLSVHLINNLYPLLKGLHDSIICWDGLLINRCYRGHGDSQSYPTVKIKPALLFTADTKVPLISFNLLFICMLVFLIRPLASWRHGLRHSHIWKHIVSSDYVFNWEGVSFLAGWVSNHLAVNCIIWR